MRVDFTYAKTNFLNKESPNSTPKVMIPSKFSRGSMAMHIGYICLMNIK